MSWQREDRWRWSEPHRLTFVWFPLTIECWECSKHSDYYRYICDPPSHGSLWGSILNRGLLFSAYKTNFSKVRLIVLTENIQWIWVTSVHILTGFSSTKHLIKQIKLKLPFTHLFTCDIFTFWWQCFWMTFIYLFFYSKRWKVSPIYNLK